MTITIPAELVSLLRDGLRFDLHGQLEQTSALIEPRDREDIRAEVYGGLSRAGGTSALLDVIGWLEKGDPRAIDVDLHEHREALLGALCLSVGVERDRAEDQEASAEDHVEAKARVAELEKLIATVGGEA